MPYIKQEDREYFSSLLAKIDNVGITSAGNLNYLITSLCKKYLSEDRESYTRHNEIIGVLESAKLEWYRRRLAKYEDDKIVENGDV